jgi:hypothetical protein
MKPGSVTDSCAVEELDCSLETLKEPEKEIEKHCSSLVIATDHAMETWTGFWMGM